MAVNQLPVGGAALVAAFVGSALMHVLWAGQVLCPTRAILLCYPLLAPA